MLFFWLHLIFLHDVVACVNGYDSNIIPLCYSKYIYKKRTRRVIGDPHFETPLVNLSHYAASMDILNTKKISNFIFNDCGVRKASR